MLVPGELRGDLSPVELRFNLAEPGAHIFAPECWKANFNLRKMNVRCKLLRSEEGLLDICFSSEFIVVQNACSPIVGVSAEETRRKDGRNR